MQDEIAVKIENLTKTYKLYDKPIDRLLESIHPLKRKYHKDFYALKNVSFDIKKGETVGIIGKNGSGKSTLLKILTGVLTPTSGKVIINGKVAALLELGAGFNPEFTGLENIYLNGTMSGYSRLEMEAKIPSIIEFADIGDFINQPVKTYSSGMFVRLAFSVAINVEPDIFIVDEALAVGDDLFQKKCFTKIDALRKAGKTIIFVSHSGGLIIDLCNRAILLDAGEHLYSGKSERVVNLYQKYLFAPKDKSERVREQIEEIFRYEMYNVAIEDSGNNLLEKEKNRVSDIGVVNVDNDEPEEFFDAGLTKTDPIYYENRGAKIFDYKILNYKYENVNVLRFGKKYTLSYKVHFSKTCYNVRFGMLIKTKTGFEISGAETANTGYGISCVKAGQVLSIEFQFTPKLTEGVYFLRCGVVGIEGDQEVFFDRQIDVLAFRMLRRKSSLMNSLVDFDIVPSVYEVDGNRLEE